MTDDNEDRRSPPPCLRRPGQNASGCMSTAGTAARRRSRLPVSSALRLAGSALIYRSGARLAPSPAGFDPSAREVPASQSVWTGRAGAGPARPARTTSLGAWFSPIFGVCKPALIKALFVSPVLDMERLICDMMRWAGVGERLRRRGESGSGKRCRGVILHMRLRNTLLRSGMCRRKFCMPARGQSDGA